MSETALVRVEEAPSPEEELTTLVLNGVTSRHTERSYRTGLEQFFTWLRSKPRQSFSKALVGEYRAHLLERKLSPSTLNLRLSPLRKLAREMADNGLLDPGVASAIERTKGVKQEGVRAGNWLLKEQANELLNAPDPSTLKGKRDRAILALLISCGLRRAELVALEVDRIQQRDGRWVIPDLVGKGNRLRTVTIPAAVKVRIDAWTQAAKISEGKVFRPVNKGDRVTGEFIADEKAIWQLVVHYARATSLGKLAPHDLRRTCAKLCRKSGGELEQIHGAHIRTDDRKVFGHGAELVGRGQRRLRPRDGIKSGGSNQAWWVPRSVRAFSGSKRLQPSFFLGVYLTTFFSEGCQLFGRPHSSA